jgi:hypothetical protein
LNIHANNIASAIKGTFTVMKALPVHFLIKLTLLINYSNVDGEAAKIFAFADDFKFGAASAAYQIEGGWNEGGKTPSIWDTYTHDNPELIADGSSADVSVDSYHLYEKDVEALKTTGVNDDNKSKYLHEIEVAGFSLTITGFPFHGRGF